MKRVFNGYVNSISEITTQPGVISLDRKVIAQTYDVTLGFEGFIEGTIVHGSITVRSTEFPDFVPGQRIMLETFKES